jgi:hypothetical protein
VSRTYLLLIFVVPLIFLLSGCARTEKAPTLSTSNAPTYPVDRSSSRVTDPLNNQDLVGTSWTLKSLGDKNNLTPVVTGRTVTLNFSNGGYGGDDGNGGNYGSGYNTNENTVATITIAGVDVPDDPPGFLRQYQTYFYLLTRTQDFQITNDELLINCTDGRSLLFSKAVDTPK